MSLKAKGRGLIHKGDKTTTGGVVTQGVRNIMFVGEGATQIGMKATCPKCKKGWGEIVPIENLNILVDNIQAALHGDMVTCGCPTGSNTLLSSVGAMTFTKVNGQIHGFKPHANEQEMNSAYEAMADTVGGRYEPSIDPKNAYWPPYDFTAPEGKKQIEVIYRSKTAKIAIFTPEEWKKLFEIWDFNGDVKTVKDTLTGLYNAHETAKALGGLGVTAIVKTIDGIEYLYLSNYDKFEQTILHGGIFRADNAQVVKMGLGALDSVKGMARYVKVNALADFLVGSGINGLKYLLTDDYTLKELGVDEAKILVNAVSTATLAYTLGLVFAPVTVAGTLSVLAVSGFAIWFADKETDFEKQLVEAVVDEFDG
ncbi:PAAR domain-containing protein [Vibrio parahaemolyticus]|nr:PAAR domain-containing protein [Vibrio parahaemolyticus]EIA1769321.1 PAAR domain-containing protein [Vibrio parahaemolyticus]